MASNLNWIPEEDPQTLFFERCWLQGVFISAITYGVTVSLYFLSFYHLIHGKGHVEFKKRLPLLIFITVSFFLGTSFMITLAAYNQMAFIDNRNYPGGPNAFETNMFYIRINDANAVVYVLSTWLSDALVVWRFKVIYHTSQVPLWIVMFVPCLMLAGSAVMGIIFLFHFSTPGPYVKIMTHLAMPFLGLSLVLNIILTIAIVLRLLAFRHRIVSIMGPQYGMQYTSISAMVIESAALYSTISIVYLVLFGIGNAVAQVLAQCLIQFQIVAMLLIVFRVAQGKGWTQNISIHATSGLRFSASESMQFSPHRASVMLESTAEASRGVCAEESEGSQRISDNFHIVRDVT